MSKKALFTTDGEIVHSSGSLVSGGTFTISTSPSSKIKASGAYVYIGSITVTLTGGSYASGTYTVVGTGTILATSVKCLESGEGILRDGDSVEITGTATNISTGATMSLTFSVECSAGQDRVNGE